MRTDILDRKSEIEQWINEGQSKVYMARELDCNPKTINPILEKLGTYLFWQSKRKRNF